ncbi:MAG: SCO1664 family protein [Anaerolineae bacterium]
MNTGPSNTQDLDILEPPQDIEPDAALAALRHGSLALHGLLPWSSNYTFLGTVTHGALKFNVVYKPCRGERPLWDFEEATLCQREVAAYHVSCALNRRPAIPPTVMRNGPHGPGMVQQFIHANYNIHYFSLKDNPRHKATFQHLALFDYLVNNADRKGGHCLLDWKNRIWAIDHGLTFHTHYKLRTVIWDYANQDIPPGIYNALNAFKRAFVPTSNLYRILKKLLAPDEIQSFTRRLDTLLASGKFPRPLGARDYPYPPI